MRITKKRVLVASIFIVLLAGAGAFAWRHGRLPAIVPPAENAYVGLTREQITDRLGTPDGHWPGHYGRPPLEWAKQYEPCETLTYSKWHGALYISVYQKNGQWVCFCSSWLPKGAVY